MIPVIFVSILFGGPLLFEIILRPIICKQKINKHIEFIGGELDSIEKLASRDQVYYVNYRKNGELMHSVVKYYFLFEEEWKED